MRHRSVFDMATRGLIASVATIQLVAAMDQINMIKAEDAVIDDALRAAEKERAELSAIISQDSGAPVKIAITKPRPIGGEPEEEAPVGPSTARQAVKTPETLGEAFLSPGREIGRFLYVDAGPLIDQTSKTVTQWAGDAYRWATRFEF